MAGKLGISLVIGALVGSSVNAAFSTVNEKIQSMRKAYSSASHQASVLGAAIKAEEALNAARKNASANNNDSKSLKALKEAEAAYEKARKAALGYGDSIDVWRRKHSEAARTTEELNTQLTRLQSLQNVRDGIEKNASQVRAAFTDLVGTVMQGAAIVKPVKIGMGFEEGMSKVQAISSSTEEDLQKLTAQARLLGATTVWSAKEASEGMSFLAMAGFKTSQILDSMPGMLSLASAGSIDLGKAADISSNILSGFGFEANRMGYVSDVLAKTFTRSNTTLESLGESMKYCAPTAKAAGQSFQDLAAMIGKLGDAGIQGSMAGTGLNAIIGRMAKPPKEASDALKQLGVKVADASGNMRALPDVFADIEKAMGKFSEQERLSLAKAIYGAEHFSKGLVLQTASANNSLQSLSKELYEEGYATKVAKEKTDNFSGDLKGLNSAAEEAAISFYEVLKPSLRDFTQDLTGLVQKAGSFINKNQELIKTLSELAAGFLGLKVGTFIYTFISSSFKTALLFIRGGFLTLQSMFIGFKNFLYIFGSGVLRFLKTFTLSWGQAFAPIRSKISSLIGHISSLRNRITGLGSSMRSLSSSIAGTVARLAAMGPRAMAASAGMAVLTGTMRVGRGVMMGFGAAVRGLGTALRVAFGPMSLLMTAIGFGVDYVIEHWDKIVPYFTALWENVKNVFSNAWEWIKELVGKMTGVFSQIGDTFNGAFKSVKDFFGFDDEDVDVKPVINEANTNKGSLETNFNKNKSNIKTEEEKSYDMMNTASYYMIDYNKDKENNNKNNSVVNPVSQQIIQRESTAQRNDAKSIPFDQKNIQPLNVSVQPVAQPIQTVQEKQVKQEETKSKESKKESFDEFVKKNVPVAATTPQVQNTSPEVNQNTAIDVGVNLDFSINGVPDQTFAQGVMKAIRERSGELESIISNIVHNQARLAYGS